MQIMDEFENQLRKDLKDDDIHGSMSAAIIKKDKMIWAKAFGPSTIQGELLATVDTIYRAGSIAKSFTAFLMMQLVQEGTIELDDPVETYLPEIRELEGYSDSTKDFVATTCQSYSRSDPGTEIGQCRCGSH